MYTCLGSYNSSGDVEFDGLHKAFKALISFQTMR